MPFLSYSVIFFQEEFNLNKIIDLMRATKLIGVSILTLIACLFIADNSQAQNLKEFEKKVTEFTLDNGMHFIIIERHDAPVASFYTHVSVGGANEPVGQTGIAHIFEHMAFKGSHYIGTTDWESEKKVIAQMDEAYKEWLYSFSWEL